MALRATPAGRSRIRCARAPAALVSIAVLLIPSAKALGAPSQAPEVLSLSTCIEAALADGPDNKILQGNLDVATEQFEATEATNAVTVSGSLGYGDSGTFGDPTLYELHSSVTGSGAGNWDGPQAGLTVNGPLTSLSVTANPYMPSIASQSSLFSLLPNLPGEIIPTINDNTGSLSVSVNQTIWNGYPGGTGLAAVKKSLLGLESQKLSTAASRLNLVYKVKQAFYSMLGAQRALDVKETIVKQQRDVYDQIRAIAALKQATEVDLKSAEINARSAVIDYQSAVYDFQIARVRLADLMGYPPGARFLVKEEAPPAMPVGSVEEAIAEGLKRRSDASEIELSRESADIDLDLVRGAQTPTVSVSGGASVLLDWQGQGDNAEVANLGVDLSLPILDGGAAKSKVEANLQQQEVYRLQEAQVERNIAADIEQAYDAVQIQFERLELARLAAEKFGLLFKLKESQVTYGTATNQDLLDASVDNANAQSDLAQAERNAQLGVLDLLNVMGE